MNVLEVHGSGKAVVLNPKFRLKTPVTPQLLNGFMSEEAFRIDHSMYMHSRDFLPMPIPASPLLCMIIQRPMFERYTDSFKTLSMLRTIVQCFALNPYLCNERIKKAHRKALEDTAELEERLHEQIQGIDGFLELMERSTFERIHVYERCVHDMFNLDVPIEACLTPVERGILAQDPEAMQKVLYHFLKNKEAIRNVRMEKSLPEGEHYTHVKYFTCQPQDQGPLYNGFLDERTVFEYFKFIQ